MRSISKKGAKLNINSLEKQLDEAWSSYIRKRDKVCQKCLKSNNVSAHHAFGRRHKATRWDVMNGVSLCYPCHIHWAHRDPSGFSYWFEQYIGRNQYIRLAESHNSVVKYKKEDLESILSTLKQME